MYYRCTLWAICLLNVKRRGKRATIYRCTQYKGNLYIFIISLNNILWVVVGHIITEFLRLNKCIHVIGIAYFSLNSILLHCFHAFLYEYLIFSVQHTTALCNLKFPIVFWRTRVYLIYFLNKKNKQKYFAFSELCIFNIKNHFSLKLISTKYAYGNIQILWRNLLCNTLKIYLLHSVLYITCFCYEYFI